VASDLVDLSSDTATRPTPAMRRAIAEAEVGDEQRREDPTVNRLEALVAETLGTESAIFLATGTLCNNIAIAAHTRRGDAVLAERGSHIIRFEAAGSAMHAGVLVDQIDGNAGTFTATQLGGAFSAGSLYFPPTRLVCLEQTHNLAGGTIWPLQQWQDVCATAHRLGAAVHVDGARLFNASMATGVPAKTWAASVDSIWVDFTKGLGAPIGAVLAGTTAFVEEARRVKHQFGAALRQAGIAAGGCLYALDHHVERLVEDHVSAARLASGLAELGCRLDPPPQTNIIYFDPAPTGVGAAEFCAGLLERGVRMGVVGTRVRAVTHLDVSAAGIETALQVAAEVVGAAAIA
jgi:threonine aldolase